MFRLISHVQFDKKYVLTAKPIKVEDRKQELGFTFRVNMPNSSFQYTTTSNLHLHGMYKQHKTEGIKRLLIKLQHHLRQMQKAPFFPSQNT